MLSPARAVRGRQGADARSDAGSDAGSLRGPSRRGAEPGPALLLPLAFQVGIVPAASLIYVGGYGGPSSRPVLVLCAVLMAATMALGISTLRGLPVPAVLAGDTALAVAANLALSATSLPSDHAVEVSWQYFAGCAALWTLARGPAVGLAVAACAMPLRLAMFATAGRVHTIGAAAVSGLGDTALVLLAVAVAAGFAALANRDAERVHTDLRRSLHDTVLQTLEAIALTLPGDADQAQRRLREVRAVAHAEAVALRRELARPAGSAPGLAEGLVGLVSELARDGLRVRLDIAEGEYGDPPARLRAALLAATREALRNILKHSGGTEALVRVGNRPGGLTVAIRDFGVGFDPAAHRPGFGLSESIAARMAEAGGRADIDARPGHGTSVTLWAPADTDEW
ncbi:MAG: sensor histidine kinase [Catenulispora sp.]